MVLSTGGRIFTKGLGEASTAQPVAASTQGAVERRRRARGEGTQ